MSNVTAAVQKLPLVLFVQGLFMDGIPFKQIQLYARAILLLSRAAGGSLSPINMK